MSDTLVEEPPVAESAPVAPIPARSFGKGAIAGILIGAVIVIAAAFGGGFLVGSGANAGSLGTSNTTQHGPGGAGGGAQNGPGGAQNGPGGAQNGGTQNGQQGGPPGANGSGNGNQNGSTNNQNG